MKNKILSYVNLLLGNARNTHAANNVGAVFSLCEWWRDTTVDSGHVMFSVGPVSAPMDWLGSNHMTFVFCEECPCCIYISE
jgi:hypothetical protein